MPRRPSYQWYPDDWRSNPRVCRCSLAARGLWHEMLDIMHGSPQYGYLTLDGMTPVSNEHLTVLVGLSGRQAVSNVKRLLEELEKREVFSRDDRSIIFSRRMVRDEERRVRHMLKQRDFREKSCTKSARLECDFDKSRDRKSFRTSKTDHSVTPSVTGRVTASVTAGPPPSSPSPSLSPIPPLLTPPPLTPSQTTFPQLALRALPPDFAEFWERYPKKRDKRRSAVEYAKAVRDTDAATVFAGLERAIAHDRRFADDEFTPHPATWLRAGGYLSEYGRPSNGAAPPAARHFSAEEWVSFYREKAASNWPFVLKNYQEHRHREHILAALDAGQRERLERDSGLKPKEQEEGEPQWTNSNTANT